MKRTNKTTPQTPSTRVTRNTKPGKLARWYRYAQLRWVRLMERLTARMSKKTMMAYLIVFLCFGIGYNVLVLAGYLVLSSVEVDGIKTPIQVEHPFELIDRWELEYHRDQIEAFRDYMDSLASHPQTRAKYDSIVAQRPELLDSVAQIANYLNNQKSK